MASTAEAVRDKDEAPKADIPPYLARPEEPKPTPTDDAPLKSFGDIASGLAKTAQEIMPSRAEMDTAREAATVAREKATRSAQDFADSQAPLIEAAKKEGANFAAEAQARRAPIDQAGQRFQQQLGQQPSRGLRPFLATSPNEPPEASITKLVTGIATFAQMIGGGRAGARGALSAMTGALEGWKAGDRDRADRAFSDWRTRTEAMLEDWRTELRDYESWMKAGGMPLEQMIQGIKLSAIGRDNQKLAEELDVARADSVFKALEHRQDAAVKLNESLARVVGAKEASDARLAERKEEHARVFDEKIRLLKMRREMQGGGVQYTPETLDRLTDQYANGAPLSELVKGWGPDATAAIKEIQNRATAKLAKEGKGGDAIMLAAANQKANRAALNDLTKTEAQFLAYMTSFELAVKRAEDMSKKVDRTGSPILNKWLLRSQSQYAGDPDVKAFDAQLEVLAQEFSRIITRKGQTTEGTRTEARNSLNSAQTPEQFQKIIDEVLRPDAEYAKRGFEERKKMLQQSIGPTAGPTVPQADDPLGIRK